MSDENVSVKLVVVEGGGRWVDAAPEGVGIGELRLLRWQVQPVDKVVDGFAGSAAYLVKVNYELDLEPDLPPLQWYELGLEFGGDASVTVVDAVPRTARAPQGAVSYDITRYLELAKVEPGKPGQVHQPAFGDSVHRHGVPGASVRWRHVAMHTDGVELGSKSGWLMLVVPEERKQVSVTLTARFALRPDHDSPHWPAQKPVPFDLALREDKPVPAVVPVVARQRKAPVLGEPSAFICYAHDTQEHKQNVRRFTDLLLAEGIDAHIDQYAEGPRKDWAHWSYGEFRTRDFILVMASPMCRAVADGDADPDKHPGLRSELEALRTLYQRNTNWWQYVLPAVLPEQSEMDIPLFLGPATRDYYAVADYTRSHIEHVLNAMRSTERRNWDLR